MYLFERQDYIGERQSHREIDESGRQADQLIIHLLVHFPKGLKAQGWVRQQLVAWKSIQIARVAARTKVKHISQYSNQHPYGLLVW